MKKIALACVALAPLVWGCGIGDEPTYSQSEQTPSTSGTPTATIEHSSMLDTSQMSVSMSAQSDGTTLKIYAALFDVATDDGVTLDQGDFFTASTGSGDPLVLVLEPSADNPYVVHYAASLPASASAQDVTIGLVRSSFGVSAPNSVLHVPAPFTISSTSSGSVALGDPIDVHVAPSLGDVDVQVAATGACLVADEDGYDPNTFDDAIVLDSNGNGEFSTEQLITSFSASPQNCDVTFYASAISDGSLDPNFAGGATGSHDAEGEQTASFDATIVD